MQNPQFHEVKLVMVKLDERCNLGYTLSSSNFLLVIVIIIVMQNILKGFACEKTVESLLQICICLSVYREKQIHVYVNIALQSEKLKI